MGSRDTRLRVLFLTLYPDIAASPRYRVTQFVPLLQAMGIECTVASAVSLDEFRAKRRPFWYHVAELRNRIAQTRDAGRYDVVFVQKAILSAYVRGAHAIVRRRARRLVYDIDDAVHLHPPNPLRGVRRLVEDGAQVRKMMAAADLVLAGNAWLKHEAEKHGGNATLFPTVVDTERFAPGPRDDRRFCIGWIGNPSTTPHLAAAAEAIGKMKDCEVHLIGVDPVRNPVPNATVVPWTFETEVSAIQSFSVGIMPLPKDEWTRGKCALKALQYMACGVPCIATPFGAVRDMIEHGASGLFAGTTREWLDAFERLRDPDERRRIGEAGRQIVADRFSLSGAALRMAALLEGLA